MRVAAGERAIHVEPEGSGGHLRIHAPAAAVVGPSSPSLPMLATTSPAGHGSPPRRMSASAATTVC